MENAAQTRAAGVRIGAESVPVKDRYREKGRENGMNSRRRKRNKNAASEGALRRNRQEIQDMRQTTNDQNFGGVSGGV